MLNVLRANDEKSGFAWNFPISYLFGVCLDNIQWFTEPVKMSKLKAKEGSTTSSSVKIQLMKHGDDNVYVMSYIHLCMASPFSVNYD